MGRTSRLLLGTLLALAACGGSAISDEVVPVTTGGAPTTEPSDDAPVIEWSSCGESVDCGTLLVPYDYDKPDIGSFTLRLSRHNAAKPDKRIGALLVNPGGPGSAGQFLAQYADQIYGQELLDHFDIIGWDPRGTGESTPFIDCIDSYDSDPPTDVTPETEAERLALIAEAQDFADACQENSGEILPYVSTEASATDIDTIRRALGEEQISYFGFSYGSELGATWTTMFPSTVRAAVLDGASALNQSRLEDSLTQIRGFEATFQTFLDRCSGDKSCAFHSDGKSAEAYDALAAQIDADPVFVEAGRTPVTLGVLETAVAQAMYDEASWFVLERGLDDLRNGDGEKILQLNDDYFQRQQDGSYPNVLEAFTSILCLDDPGKTSVDEVDANVPLYKEAAPRLGPGSARGYICALWPVRSSGRIEITGKGAGPIVVIGTTGDAATPLEAAKETADLLEEGHLIVVVANQHTGYNVNDCVNDAVHAYLVDLETPSDGLRCK